MWIRYSSLFPCLVSGSSFCVPALKWTHFEAGLCFGKVCQHFHSAGQDHDYFRVICSKLE